MMTNKNWLVTVQHEDGSLSEIRVSAPNKIRAVTEYRKINPGYYNSVIKGNYPIVYSVAEV